MGIITKPLRFSRRNSSGQASKRRDIRSRAAPEIPFTKLEGNLAQDQHTGGSDLEYMRDSKLGSSVLLGPWPAPIDSI